MNPPICTKIFNWKHSHPKNTSRSHIKLHKSKPLTACTQHTARAIGVLCCLRLLRSSHVTQPQPNQRFQSALENMVCACARCAYAAWILNKNAQRCLTLANKLGDGDGGCTKSPSVDVMLLWLHKNNTQKRTQMMYSICWYGGVWFEYFDNMHTLANVWLHNKIWVVGQ